MSGLSELSSSIRDMTRTVASASSAEVIRVGTVDGVSTKMEPNKILNDAPVVELSWVPRYRNSAARPRAAPSTTPVATSRPRRRWTPIISMNAAAPAPNARYPQNWLTPSRNAAEPPVVEMSAREWPANDCPRVTVNTPTTADVTAITAPTASATCTGPLPKKPGSKTYLNRCPTL